MMWWVSISTTPLSPSNQKLRMVKPGFSRLASRLSGFSHVWPLGGYAVPLTPAELEAAPG